MDGTSQQVSSSSAAMTPDQCAAHEFLSEMRTRIATQPLPYQYGVEVDALESLRELFDLARTAMKNHPGCREFADLATRMLNEEIRPLTAKWHRAYKDGRLDSKDGSDEFRQDLALVQGKLRKEYASKLRMMAYNAPPLKETFPPAISEQELSACFGEVSFGIPPTTPGSEKAMDINASEAEEVDKRRRIRGAETIKGKNAIGLAFSGGGIRSATFCLGVTQVFAEKNLLKSFDYLSTVSGGGYTGAFVTARLGVENGLDKDLAGPNGPDPACIRYLRQHAEYIMPANLRESWLLITSALAGMLLNWTAPFLVITLAALGSIWFSGILKDRFWPATLSCLLAVTGFSLLLYCVLLRKGKKGIRIGGTFLAAISGLTVLLLFAWLIRAGYGFLPTLIHKHWPALGGLAFLFTAGPAVMRFLPGLREPRFRKLGMKVILVSAGLVVPLVALALFYGLLYVGQIRQTALLPGFGVIDGRFALLCLAGLLAIVSIVFLNINLTSPHRIYRDRLAKTFIQTSEKEENPLPLSTMNDTSGAPYHLINCTLNLPSSTSPSLRDRKCDFFLFSKHWCGSPVIGYQKTEKWKIAGSEMDLATAMAISGAAASSHMGLETRASLAALMAFFNLRMDFWIKNPAERGILRNPGFACLLREISGIGMSERQSWLNLSDGGHIENLAVYELLRRRCKFIVCVDGEADPDFTFAGLLTLVRHAQIDFGIHIEPQLDDLRPDPKTRCCHAHAMLCRINYPAVGEKFTGGIGLLLYIKLGVTGNEPELVHRYRIAHPEFPHQTTLDQFFDQEQFEAYRQLGVHAAEGLFSQVLMNGKSDPLSIQDWFRRLSANLLESKPGIKPLASAFAQL